MAEKVQATWTCDRCGARENYDYSVQPRTWRRLTQANPPRAESEVIGDLCETCYFDFDFWYRMRGRYENATVAPTVGSASQSPETPQLGRPS